MKDWLCWKLDVFIQSACLSEVMIGLQPQAEWCYLCVCSERNLLSLLWTPDLDQELSERLGLGSSNDTLSTGNRADLDSDQTAAKRLFTSTASGSVMLHDIMSKKWVNPLQACYFSIVK